MTTVLDLIRDSAASFFSADLDDEQGLSFDEFRNMLPTHIRDKFKDSTLREIFGDADSDGDGRISRKEFFFWTLRAAHEQSGSSSSNLERCFTRFDLSGDGELNLSEFTQMVERFGFGELGHEIFGELDTDQTGTVSYVELMQAISAHTGSYSKNCQRLLAACAFDLSNGGDESSPSKRQPAKRFPSTPWVAEDAKSLRQHIRNMMVAQLAKPYDVWQSLVSIETGDKGVDNGRPGQTLSAEQFGAAMRGILGFTGEEDVLQLVYGQMDDTESDSVSFAQVTRGKRPPQSPARNPALKPASITLPVASQNYTHRARSSYRVAFSRIERVLLHAVCAQYAVLQLDEQ